MWARYILPTLALVSFASAQTVYLIRHGEKPASGNGLSVQGEERAQCLRTVFGASSGYDIGYIMAQTPQPDGTQQRPYDTVAPLAADLGLEVDISCQRDDSACVANAVWAYSGPGNILICWEHKALNDLVAAINPDNIFPEYPDASYDLIWTDPYAYSQITSVTSEACPGLDV